MSDNEKPVVFIQLQSLAKALEEFDLRPEDILYLDHKDNVRLNPLYEAAIIERIQFDGDIPELRIGGNLPPGGTPAVPVDTRATSPVALGMMLKVAQESVHKEILEIEQKRDDRIREITARIAELVDTEEGAISVVEAEREIDKELSRPVFVEGYKGGEVPAMRKVDTPSGSSMLLLTSKKRREMAWKAVSTTQGRKSAVPGIVEFIKNGLRDDGHDVKFVDGWRTNVRGMVVSRASWIFTLHGQDETQPNFSPIEAGRNSLLARLSRNLIAGRDWTLELEVSAVNEVSDRRVGWKAQLIRVG